MHTATHSHTASTTRQCSQTSAARPVHSMRRRQRCASTRTAALPEWLRKTLDFGSWAPKSARIWRLQEYEVPDPREEPENPDPAEDSINDLQIRASEMAKQEKEQKDGTSPAYASSSGSLDSLSSADQADMDSKTFSEADDGELAQALRARMQSIASSSSEDEEDEQAGSLGVEEGAQASQMLQDGGATFVEEAQEDDDDVDPLSGEEMRELIWTKYGKAYDVSFARRDVPGKAFVCLNIMWQHLEQRSFKMTEAQYMDKVDSVAYMVNVLGQTARVREFLSSRARSERGLPRRPVVGTAISIQLDLPPDVVKDFFGSGYY